MSLGLWAQGNTDPQIYKQLGDGRLNVTYQGRLVKVMRSEAREWADDWFFSCLDLWWRWRTFGGLPFAGGWADQPSHMVEIIETAEAAWKAIERK